MKYILLVILFITFWSWLYYWSLETYYARIVEWNQKHMWFLSWELFVFNRDNAQDIASDYRRNLLTKNIVYTANNWNITMEEVNYNSFVPLYGNIAFDRNNIYRDWKKFISYNKEFKVYPWWYLYDWVILYYIPSGKKLINIDNKNFEIFSWIFIANDKQYNGLYVVASGQYYFNGEILSWAKKL